MNEISLKTHEGKIEYLTLLLSDKVKFADFLDKIYNKASKNREEELDKVGLKDFFHFINEENIGPKIYDSEIVKIFKSTDSDLSGRLSKKEVGNMLKNKLEDMLKDYKKYIAERTKT